MKTLLLMRHGKSSFKDEKLKDRDRHLAKRGHKNAVQMGQLLKEQELIPQLLLSSAVERSKETAEDLLSSADNPVEVVYLEHLFMAEPDLILDALKLLSDSYERVMVIGHNPGLESLVQILTGQIESLPTAAIAFISLPISSWRELKKDVKAELIQLWKPKDI